YDGGFNSDLATVNLTVTAPKLDVIDPTFGVGGWQIISFGPTSENLAADVAVQVDGSVVVAGWTYDSSDNSEDFFVARLTNAGQLDPAFGIGGKQTFNFGPGSGIANGVAVQADGSVIVVGSAYISDISKDFFAVARLTNAGQLDPTFGVGGMQTIDFGTTNS